MFTPNSLESKKKPPIIVYIKPIPISMIERLFEYALLRFNSKSSIPEFVGWAR